MLEDFGESVFVPTLVFYRLPRQSVCAEGPTHEVDVAQKKGGAHDRDRLRAPLLALDRSPACLHDDRDDGADTEGRHPQDARGRLSCGERTKRQNRPERKPTHFSPFGRGSTSPPDDAREDGQNTGGDETQDVRRHPSPERFVDTQPRPRQKQGECPWIGTRKRRRGREGIAVKA